MQFELFPSNMYRDEIRINSSTSGFNFHSKSGLILLGCLIRIEVLIIATHFWTISAKSLVHFEYDWKLVVAFFRHAYHFFFSSRNFLSNPSIVGLFWHQSASNLVKNSSVPWAYPWVFERNSNVKNNVRLHAEKFNIYKS